MKFEMFISVRLSLRGTKSEEFIIIIIIIIHEFHRDASLETKLQGRYQLSGRSHAEAQEPYIQEGYVPPTFESGVGTWGYRAGGTANAQW